MDGEAECAGVPGVAEGPGVRVEPGQQGVEPGGVHGRGRAPPVRRCAGRASPHTTPLYSLLSSAVRNYPPSSRELSPPWNHLPLVSGRLGRSPRVHHLCPHSSCWQFQYAKNGDVPLQFSRVVTWINITQAKLPQRALYVPVRRTTGIGSPTRISTPRSAPSAPLGSRQTLPRRCSSAGSSCKASQVGTRTYHNARRVIHSLLPRIVVQSHPMTSSKRHAVILLN